VTSRLLLSLLPLLLAIGTANAVSLPQLGQRVSQSIEMLGKPIPLPPGEWQVGAAGFGQIAGQDPGPYGAIGGVLLLRTDSEAGEFLLLHTNALPVRAGWGEPPECGDEQALFRSVGEPRNLHNACAFVVALRRGQLMRSHLPGLGGSENAESLAAVLPSWALVGGFRVSDRRDMLDVRYGIAPRRPDPSAWFAAQAPTDAAHRSVVKELSDWAQTARASALAALRDPADQGAAMPGLTLSGGQPAEMPPEEQISALRLSLYKLATYRVPSSLFTVAVSSIAAGDLYLGLWIAFWQSLTHSAVYVGNELAWEWPRPTPVMPLVGGGSVTPVRQAQIGTLPHQTAAPVVQLAANSAQLPAGALPLRDSFAVDGKQVPLPAGSWTRLGDAIEDGVTTTILGRIEGTVLHGLVILHTNVTKTPAILGPSSDCGRRDVLFTVTRYDTPEDGFCAYGKRVVPMTADERTQRDNRPWSRVAQQLAEAGIALPPHLLMVGARARTRANFVDARYYFAPPTGDAAQTALALQNWADLVQEPLELGVRGRMGPNTPVAPWPWERVAVQAALRAQVRAPLEGLVAAGALAQDASNQQAAVADAADADREQQRLSLWSRSFLKVATYRVAAYLDTFAVQTFFTASPGQGVAVASVHAVAKPVIAYANEIFWAQSGHGKAPAALLSANFPEISSDQ